MLVPTGFVHAHILTNLYRAGVVVSHSELVEPGAATCTCRGLWMGHDFITKSERKVRSSLSLHSGMRYVVGRKMCNAAFKEKGGDRQQSRPDVYFYVFWAFKLTITRPRNGILHAKASSGGIYFESAINTVRTGRFGYRAVVSAIFHSKSILVALKQGEKTYAGYPFARVPVKMALPGG